MTNAGSEATAPARGCLSKLPAIRLQGLLESAYEGAFGKGAWNPMRQPEDSADLAIEARRVLVSTDFGPPAGACAADAGRIAALHGLSDIYASGGIPHWASTILVLGEESNSESDFAQHVLTSLLRTCREEEVEVKGGHTVLGSETMIGLTVIGTPRNGVVLRKTGGRVGDRLLLSKPLGTGLMMKSHDLGLIGRDEFAEAVRHMSTSNREASRLAVQAKVHAATDVSGFGLLGHLSQMLSPGQGATLSLSRTPVLSGVTALPERFGCALSDNNLWYVRSQFCLEGFRENARFYPLADPQTNGGLLVAADNAAASLLLDRGFHSIGFINDSKSSIVITEND